MKRGCKGMNRRHEIRLGSRELFVYYNYKLGSQSKLVMVGGCTNKRILSERTGIDYNTLMWQFTRKNRNYYDNGEYVVMKLRVMDILKGSQSFPRRGKGGMEKFVEKYVMKKTEY